MKFPEQVKEQNLISSKKKKKKSQSNSISKTKNKLTTYLPKANTN